MGDELTPEQIIGTAGRIAARLSSYEHRPQQLQMANAVTEAITHQQHLIVEAGTGVGKSFAYLIPSILAATADRDADQDPFRAVIATHTISLQEQLLSKDIPFLNSVIPREFSTVLVKGRRNYLSRRRFKTALVRAGSTFFQDDQFDQLSDIAAWVDRTQDGSLSDLDYKPQGVVWDEVASDHGNCMGRRCPTFNTCFYYKARRRVRHAQLLIVNHALLFSDLALRAQGVSILPDYNLLVLDEAHMVPTVASSHLGISVSSSQIDYVLSRLYNDRAQRGLLVHFKLKEAQLAVQKCRFAAADFFGSLDQWMQSHPGSNGRVAQPRVVSNQLSEKLRQLARMIQHHAELAEEGTDQQDLVSAGNRLLAIAGEVHAWLEQQVADAVYWLEVSVSRWNKQRFTLRAAPLEVGPVLREHLFNQTPSVILTSATLSVGSEANFDYFKSQVGLSRCRSLRLGSPFNYRRQAKLVLVQGMPDPTAAADDYDRLCAAMVQRYAGRTDGHTFVLFTSYRMLKAVAARLAPWLAEQDLALYSQADGMPRHLMVERFKADPRAVLMGTDSFWQGVDVPGDALQCVIIPRLPFSVPDQPLLAARLDAMRRAGRNPFMECQVPEAIIKLRQGFGRLIRTQQDRGAVVILDPRIHTKRYGRAFVQSLPDCEIIEEHVAQTDDAQRWSPG